MNIHLPVFHQIVIVSTFNAVSFLTDAGEGAEPGLVPCSGPFFRKKTLAVCNTSMYTSVIWYGCLKTSLQHMPVPRAAAPRVRHQYLCRRQTQRFNPIIDYLRDLQCRLRLIKSVVCFYNQSIVQIQTKKEIQLLPSRLLLVSFLFVLILLSCLRSIRLIKFGVDETIV